MWTRRTAILLAGAALAACGGERAPESDGGTAAAEPGSVMEGMPDMGGMQGMEGMQGMGGMQMDGGMMAQMQAHMQEMEGVGGERMRANMARHRQMVANMIAQFNREMRDMRMDADAKWNQTVDSLRQDLRQMPEMTAAELDGFMPEHRARVMRLMEMHREMMGNMQR